MGVYVYCFVGADQAGAYVGATGVGGGETYAVSSEGIAAIVSDIGETRGFPGPDGVERAVERHMRVLGRGTSCGGALPVRFGSVMASERAVAGFIFRNREGLLAELERLQGRVQLSVRVRAQPGEVDRLHAAAYSGRGPDCCEGASRGDASATGAGSERPLGSGRGRQYIEQLMSARRAKARFEQACLDACRGLVLALEARGYAVRPLGPDGEEWIVRLAVLVPAVEVQAAAEFVRNEGPSLGRETVVTGPWPAFDFVEFRGTEG